MITQPESGLCVKFHAATKSELHLFLLRENMYALILRGKKGTQLKLQLKQKKTEENVKKKYLHA